MRRLRRSRKNCEVGMRIGLGSIKEVGRSAYEVRAISTGSLLLFRLDGLSIVSLMVAGGFQRIIAAGDH